MSVFDIGYLKFLYQESEVNLDLAKGVQTLIMLSLLLTHWMIGSKLITKVTASVFILEGKEELNK